MLCPLYLLHLLELYTDDNLLLTRLLKTYANQPQNNGNLGTCVFTSVGHRGVICHTIITVLFQFYCMSSFQLLVQLAVLRYYQQLICVFFEATLFW